MPFSGFMFEPEALAAKSREKLDADIAKSGIKAQEVYEGAQNEVRNLITSGYRTDPDSPDVLIGMALACTVIESTVTAMLEVADPVSSMALATTAPQFIDSVMRTAAMLADATVNGKTRTEFEQLVKDQEKPGLPPGDTGYL